LATAPRIPALTGDAADKASEMTASDTSKLILVVDDDEAVRETAVMLIESLGYRVESAANATDALRLVRDDGIDAVLTDVMMPGMNGFQLAQRIRAVKPDMPVICVTGYSNVIDDRRSCDIVLQKPYHTATIERTLAKVLEPDPV
jgi:CheY-like chemotaxis protein